MLLDALNAAHLERGCSLFPTFVILTATGYAVTCKAGFCVPNALPSGRGMACSYFLCYDDFGGGSERIDSAGTYRLPFSPAVEFSAKSSKQKLH